MRKWVVGIVVALFAALFGGPTAAADSIGRNVVATYTYDSYSGSVSLTATTKERGPPAAKHDYVAPGLALDALRRPSARPESAGSSPIYTYDDSARLVPVARAMATTPEQARDDDAALSALALAGVAAKSESALVKHKEWPDNDGFFAGFEKDTVLQPGTRIDRYGSNRGSFVSPEGTPFKNRGLPSSRAGDPYSSFTVQKPITVRGGIAAPWMDSPGGGVQYLLPRSVQELLDGGFLG